MCDRFYGRGAFCPAPTHPLLHLWASPKIPILNRVKNNGNECFLWCHIGHFINPLKIHPQRIAKADENLTFYLDYEDIEFLVSKKDFVTIEKKSNICINVFCCENELIYLVYVSDQKFQDSSIWLFQWFIADNKWK